VLVSFEAKRRHATTKQGANLVFSKRRVSTGRGSAIKIVRRSFQQDPSRSKVQRARPKIEWGSEMKAMLLDMYSK